MPRNRKSRKGTPGHSSNCSQELASDSSQDINNEIDNKTKPSTRNQSNDSSISSPRKLPTNNGSHLIKYESASSQKKLNRKRSSTKNQVQTSDSSDVESISLSQNNETTQSPQPKRRHKTKPDIETDSPRRKSSRLNKSTIESDQLNSSQESASESTSAKYNNNLINNASRKRKCSESSDTYSGPISQKVTILKEELVKLSLPISKRLKHTNGVESVFQESNSSDDLTNNNVQKCVVPSVSTKWNTSDNDWAGWSDGNNLSDKDPLERVWQSSSSPSCNLVPEKNARSFSLLSYNIYSDTSNHTCDEKKRLSSNFSNNSRHKLLLREIRHISPDIICFQEVNQQYYDDVLKKDLQKSFPSFEERYAENDKLSGLAIFFNKEKFKELHYEVINLPAAVEPIISELSAPESVKASIHDYLNVPRHLQIFLLQNLTNQDVFLLANLQAGSLSSKTSATVSIDINCTQICGALWKINDILTEHVSVKSKNKIKTTKQNIPWILCGDFGASAHSPVYQICRDGYPSDQSLLQLQKLSNISIPGYSKNQALVNILWRAFQHPFTDLFSSYQYVLGREPPMTVNDKDFVGCNDFIWTDNHHNSLRPYAVLVPRCSYMKNLKDALPNDKLPSKHSSLACRFALS